MNSRRDLATTLKFSTVPRKAQLAVALVTFYGGPIRREEFERRVGLELEHNIRSALLSLFVSVGLVLFMKSLLRIMLVMYLRFSVNMSGRRGRRYNSSGPKKSLAIRSIIFRFPLGNENDSANSGQLSSDAGPCDSLKISIMKSRRALDSGSESERNDRKLSHFFEYSAPTPVKYEWGKELEVKLEPPVVIDKGDFFKVKVRQVRSV